MNATLARWLGPSRTLLVLRLAMTVAWAWIAVSNAALARPRGPGLLAIEVFGFLVFLAAMWAALDRAPRNRATARTWALLAVQVAACLTMATDLALLVAVELPLVLRPRQAVTVFASLLVVMTLAGLALERAGAFAAAPELVGLSRPLQVWLTLGSVAGWELLAFACGLLAATEIRARREVHRLVAELRLTNRKLDESSREAERLHIARELHDTLGHRLAALGVSLDLESRRAAGASAGPLREARDATQNLLAEVREVVGALRLERAFDLKRGIAALVSGLGAIEADLAVSPGFEVRDPAAAHALYRCAQEALTNVLRHAQASRVRVDLDQDAAGVTLTVRDDGEGAVRVREGHGLAGMRERLEALGGSLRVEARPGAGFAIVARLPAGGASR